jgi:hypothetical protein
LVGASWRPKMFRVEHSSSMMDEDATDSEYADLGGVFAVEH